MADYEGLIRVGVQGISEIDRLNRGLEKAAENFGNIENSSIAASQIGQSASRRLESARRRMERAGYERTQANRILENVDQRRNPRTGRFEPGPNATARRLASANLRLAQRETREAARSLAEEERNRRLVSAAERRYAIALNEAADSMAGIQNSIGQRQDAMDRLARRIGGEARGNYLTNLFQGRQAEFVRGGAGRNLPRNLQAQARANLAAWELTNVGGRENLTLMSRLATEISGLVRQQNEMNRRRTSRSTTYETGRRGQERITELSRMPGADPERIRRLRSQATQVIAAGYRNDAPEIRLTTRRMNASIARYQRELEAAARELREQRVAQVRDFNIRQGWRAITAEAQQRAEQNRRALPSKNLLAERIARTPGAMAPVDLIKLREKREADFAAKQKSSAKNLNVQLGWQKALEDMQNIQLSIQRGSGERFRKKLEAEQKRQERLGIGATTPMRVGAPVRRIGAIPLGGGIDSGILPKALPDKNLLAQRIARTPGAMAPVRLDELQKQQERIARMRQREQERIARMRQREQERIARQNQREQERIARMRQIASPMKGTKDILDSPAYLEEQQKQANANERLKTAMERQFSAIAAREDRLSRLGEKGIDTSQLQIRLDKAKTLAGDSSIKAQEKFKRSIIDLDRNIVRLSASVRKEAKAAAETRQRRVGQMRNFNIRQSWRAITEEAQQRAEQNRRALPSKNLLAERIARTPGGTAPTRLDELKEQEEKRLAREAKMAPVPGKRLREKQEAEQKRQERLGVGVNAPARVGGPVRRSGAIPMGGQGGRFGMFDQYSSPAGPGNPAGAREFREIQRIAGMRQIASPIQGTKDIVDSPAWKKEQKRINKRGRGAQTASGFFRGDARKAIGEGLIGGAFPALFGQGAAASAGGFVGGAVGGAIGGSFGFGLSLIGTALGQLLDTTAQNLKDLASSLKSPNDAMAALEASGFRVSDSLKFQVEQLQAVGRGYDAQTLVLKEAEKRLGAGSVKELNALSTEQKKLDESYAILAGTIQRSIIPGVIGFTLVLQDLLGFLNGIGKSRDPSVDLSKRNYRLNPFTGKFADIGPVEKTGYQKRVDQAIARASQAPPRSPQERFADETTRIQESRKIADQIQSAYREAFNLQRQAHDLQRDGATLSKEIADYTYRKEREIFDLKQQAAEKQIENNRATAQNRIESGDLSARQTFAAAVGFEQQLLSNVREVVRARKEGEADIEQSRNRLELAMARLNRDVEDYKRTNAREIEDIERRKLAYVRSVEDYKMRVADYVLERSRQSADLMRQAMVLPEASGTGAAGNVNGATSGTGGSTAAPYVQSRPGERQLPTSTILYGWNTPVGLQIPLGSLEELVDKAAKQENVDPRLLTALIKKESGFSQRARGSSGEIGLTQLKPGTARELGVDPYDIEQNLIGGARYLRRMINEFGLEGGLRAYNQGPGAQRATPRGNTAIARAYPNEVLAYARQFGFKPAAMPSPASRAPATMGGAMFGRTGRMSLREGYGMVDLRGGTRGAIIADAADAIVNRASAGMRTWIGGGGGLDIEATNLRGQALTAALQQGMRAHETRGANPATAIDLIAKLGEPLGIAVGGISNRGGATGVAGTTSRGTLALHLAPGSVGAAGLQAMAATQISEIPKPVLRDAPIGPTPSVAPINAARVAAAAAMGGNEKEAQRILEEGIKLKQKGIELGQIEAILQTNQLPQLQQQGDALKQQIEARQKIVNLSDNAASIADIEAESRARLKQIEATRISALAQVQKQYKGDVALVRQVNQQAELATKIAKGEEKQRRINLELSNKLQNSEQARLQILQLQEGVAISKVELAALERGELQAGAVELLKASTLYQRSDEAQKSTLVTLTAQTEELEKQKQFMERLVGLQLDATYAGAGLRSGRIGAEARAFEQGLKENRGDIGKATALANATRAAEDRQMVWGNLEKDIVNTSNAIAGSLTNGLLDIVSGAKQIEDVGRDILDTIARSFADSAQQQLATLLQRQFAGMVSGSIGAGATAAGPQALNGASLTAAGSLGFLNNAALALGATLQTIAGQSTLYGQMGGGLGLAGLFSGAGSAAASGASGLFGFSSSIPQLAPALESVPNFAGFFAKGGILRQGEFGVVGEKEPEFFFPGVTGTVVPRSTVEKAAELRQANQTPGKIDLSYTVTEQRGERYVTEEQFRKSNARMLQQSQAMFVSSVRQNSNVRNSMGL